MVASWSKGFAQRNYEHLISLTHGDFRSSVEGRVILFLFFTQIVALEIVRRFYESKCQFLFLLKVAKLQIKILNINASHMDKK